MISRNPITVLRAHFNGKDIVLDEPPPPDLPPGTPVEVRYERPVSGNGQAPADESGREETLLDKIAKLAKPRGLPPDYSSQHDHYVKGLPKR